MWQKKNNIFELISEKDDSLLSVKFFFKKSNWYWNYANLIDNKTSRFAPSHSGITSYGRTNWTPQTSIQSYSYLSTILIDILSKREALYRDLFLKKDKIINLPLYLTSTPTHFFFKELKSSFMYIDKIVNQNEYSRDVYFNSLNYFNYILLSSYYRYMSDSFNFSYSLEPLFFYFFKSTFFKNDFKNNNNMELYKNQYRPMKKGISNMIRLHATGAIAMPTEMRIQILASSKDVIHSWAIPSAGIKIDCVPGYSSHRVIIFFSIRNFLRTMYGNMWSISSLNAYNYLFYETWSFFFMMYSFYFFKC